jgi:hypothetical protein
LLVGVATGMAPGAEQELQGLCAVTSHHDFVQDVVPLERSQRQGLVVGVVLDEQDEIGAHQPPPSGAGDG